MMWDITDFDNFTWDPSRELFVCDSVDEFETGICPVCGYDAVGTDVDEHFGDLKVTRCCENHHTWTEVYGVSRVYFGSPACAYEVWAGNSETYAADRVLVGGYRTEEEGRKAFADMVHSIFCGENPHGYVSVCLDHVTGEDESERIGYFSCGGR